eukprot:TRINITY_DN10588_c0_g1_i3.p1 TRINITY_DN10588_c0_g1~~TRINITY_DN10588_c0_g1_i3.p1  ORF type:complete len:287 (+),score=48.32 TRINITY_DN10588_c0_g1_i3:171-1031(+)
MLRSLVGSEMCIRDRVLTALEATATSKRGRKHLLPSAATVRVVYPCLPPTQSITPISASSSILLPTPSTGALRSFMNYTRLLAVGPVILVIPDRSRRLLILDAATLECLKELKPSYAHDAASPLDLRSSSSSSKSSTPKASTPSTVAPSSRRVVAPEPGTKMCNKTVDIVLSPSPRLSATATTMEALSGISNTITNTAAFTTTTLNSSSSTSTTSSNKKSTNTGSGQQQLAAPPKLLSTWQQPFIASNNDLTGAMWQGELVSFAVNATGTAIALVDRSGHVSTFKI